MAAAASSSASALEAKVLDRLAQRASAAAVTAEPGGRDRPPVSQPPQRRQQQPKPRPEPKVEGDAGEHWRAPRYRLRHHRDEEDSSSEGSSSSEGPGEVLVHGRRPDDDSDEEAAGSSDSDGDGAARFGEKRPLHVDAEKREAHCQGGSRTDNDKNLTALRVARLLLKRLFRFFIGGAALCSKKELRRCVKQRRDTIRMVLLTVLVVYVLILVIAITIGMGPPEHVEAKPEVPITDLHELPRHAWRAAGLGPPPDDLSGK
eukprot:CAMPEP_0178416010 /NCGR_PEP_ID=MMETSP0689_2-20121128/23842_1 /TAXON_ID=160604 /ORGANISM="Amphidinium massartii, Strain CS-259" /LENGTH=259 /DNA_ID=CAMNT_0020037339 /DNA_START=18 /DNA_END=797 /DNA_ORIENTATION=+